MDTQTQGIDLVVNYRHSFGDGSRFSGTLAGNYNKTRFVRIAGTPAPIAALGITTPLFDLTQQLRFADSLPPRQNDPRPQLCAQRYHAISAFAFNERSVFVRAGLAF
ncbi:hypothetical protein [Sphingomonas carotinifaciens]|uniref:TonB-dependent receptor n=1 Tax=Sphingomonas carotinifaciens TaxID=1166323 RepID=A0A1G7M5U2_9SPHN|nr:hypothetical protein [Sphingomonas carotinifaciens]MBB4088072.1 hypothetical protein [Sphingomonas carotinifaciens]MWC45019.1 hypothetical protein [Sphingomonas carotinifaciens]SDF57034.1 hypothetical protein SAMN05216557_10479 [Sphingomonas carotinifaciens]